MKRTELVFSAVLVPVDYLMIVAAGLVAYRLRFREIASLRPVVYELPLKEFIPILIGVGLIWVCVFALSGLYTMRGTRRFLDEIVKIFLACSTGVLFLMVLIFFQRELFSSRFIILAGWLLAIVSVSIGRLIVRSIQHALLQKGYGLRNVLIIGSGETASLLIRQFRASPQLGYRVLAEIPMSGDAAIEQLGGALQAQPIDEVILADPSAGRETRLKMVDLCHDRHVSFKYAADLLDAAISNVIIETIIGRPMIEIKRTPLDGWGRILKRITDTFSSAIILLVLSPLLICVAIIIKLDSPGPVFYRSERVGERERRFGLYKFRSMVENAHAMKPELMKYNERNDGPLFKMKNDPRITRFGKFIRRTSLDELPQLYNILRGEMSMVGPRPHEPEEVRRYQKEQRKLLAIKPGITGLAQISGRSELNFNEEARLDIYYIEHWSPLLDFKILLRTPWVVLSAKSAS